MKVLQNKETTLKNPDGETNAVYADLIAVALNAVPQGGISPSEMRKRLRIMKAVEAAPNANDLIKFEDNDADNLKGYVNATSGSFGCRFSVAMVLDMGRYPGRTISIRNSLYFLKTFL